MEAGWVSSWDFLESEKRFLRFVADEDRGGCGVMEGTGANSFAIRASMNVTNVKETLCAGE